MAQLAVALDRAANVEASPSLALHSDAAASLILARIRGLLLPSKEPETLLFVALAVPVAVAVMWMVWRVIVWCVFFTAGFSLWVKKPAGHHSDLQY